MSQPMYRRIADDLQHKIESRELPAGAQLKSEGELREEYGVDGIVSRNTVRDAVKLLVARGLVETRPGQGTFVVRRMTPFLTKLNTDDPGGWGEEEVLESEVRRRGRAPEQTIPEVRVQLASGLIEGLVASQLQLGKDAQVISRSQERRIDGIPWSLQTTYYPMDLLQRGPEAARLLKATSIEEGVIRYLKEKLGINQAGWCDTIIARTPRGAERAFFDLPDKVQVSMLEIRRTGYDDDGTPIRFTVTVYPADRNQLELAAGRVPTRT